LLILLVVVLIFKAKSSQVRAFVLESSTVLSIQTCDGLATSNFSNDFRGIAEQLNLRRLDSDLNLKSCLKSFVMSQAAGVIVSSPFVGLESF
jgi:hypothetical protein